MCACVIVALTGLSTCAIEQDRSGGLTKRLRLVHEDIYKKEGEKRVLSTYNKFLLSAQKTLPKSSYER